MILDLTAGVKKYKEFTSNLQQEVYIKIYYLQIDYNKRAFIRYKNIDILTGILCLGYKLQYISDLSEEIFFHLHTNETLYGGTES